MHGKVRLLLCTAILVLFPLQQAIAQMPDWQLQPVPVAPYQPPTPGPVFPLPRQDPIPQYDPVPAIPLPRQDPVPQYGTQPIVPATPLFIQYPVPAQPAAVLPPPFIVPPGFYGLFELDLLFPDLHGTLIGTTVVTGVPVTVAVPSTNLDVTGSSRTEIGYRLAPDVGAVAISYRSIVSKGATNIANFDALGPGFLTTQLNVNVVDIDYVSPAISAIPLWDVAFRAGIRTAFAYFDNEVTGMMVQQQATNNFIGAGPHVTAEVGRSFALLPGLAAVAKLDGAFLVGNVSQSFTEVIQFPKGPLVGGTSRYDETQTVPVVTFNLGLSYTPPGSVDWARFGIGYQLEYWWDIGTRGASQGDFSGNAFYFRGEFNF